MQHGDIDRVADLAAVMSQSGHGWRLRRGLAAGDHDIDLLIGIGSDADIVIGISRDQYLDLIIIQAQITVLQVGIKIAGRIAVDQHFITEKLDDRIAFNINFGIIAQFRVKIFRIID